MLFRSDLLVIYEGAEDAAEMDLLARQGVGYVQGYAVARPMPMAATLEWIDGLATDPR